MGEAKKIITTVFAKNKATIEQVLYISKAISRVVTLFFLI